MVAAAIGKRLFTFFFRARGQGRGVSRRGVVARGGEGTSRREGEKGVMGK